VELDLAQGQFRRTGCSINLEGEKLLDAASQSESSDVSEIWFRRLQAGPQCGEPPALGSAIFEMGVAGGSRLPLVFKLKSSDTLYEFISEKDLMGEYKNLIAETIKAGNYTVTVTTPSGCSVDSVFTIKKVPAVNVRIEDIPDTCSRGVGGFRIKMQTGTAPFTYQVGNNIQTDSLFAPLLRGGYTLIVTDSNRCRQQFLVTIFPIIPPLPISGLTVTASKSCGAQGTGEIRFTYLPDAKVSTAQLDDGPAIFTDHFTGLTVGQHRLRLQTATCLFDTVINVPATAATGPTVRFNRTQPDCKTNTGTLELVITNIAGPFTIKNRNAVFTGITRFSNLAPGGYLFIITDANGCEWSFSDTIFPHVPIVPSVDSAVSINACLGRGSIRLAMAGPEAPYRFEVDGSLYNSGAQSVDLVAGTYPITIYNAARCAVNTIQFTVPPKSGCDTIHAIYVPSAFTPNGDGKNDILEPLGNPLGKVVRFVFRVYNRSGQVVFESRTPGKGWDGKYKGIQQPSATYVWVFQGTATDGKPVNYKGTTVLIR
jgi:gliding motility-associated-like protein